MELEEQASISDARPLLWARRRLGFNMASLAPWHVIDGFEAGALVATRCGRHLPTAVEIHRDSPAGSITDRPCHSCQLRTH
jgi:hypothetical protein